MIRRGGFYIRPYPFAAAHTFAGAYGMRPYGVTERLFTVLRHILALGVVDDGAVHGNTALGGFGLVQRIADGGQP